MRQVRGKEDFKIDLLGLYKPAKLAVEDLRYFVQRVINRFPKTVKRMLIGFGLGKIKGKLLELQEEYGIEVVYVNPAYSSQACSSCGYVDKENRKSRSEFECKLRGKFLHADMNASRNLLSRAKWRMCLHSVKRAFAIQALKFLESLNSKRFQCLWSKARSLLVGIPTTVHEPEVWNRCPC